MLTVLLGALNLLTAHAITTVYFSGLQQVYAHGLVVCGNYAYIDASTDASISGSNANGLDALFLKLNLLNGSFVWQYRLGAQAAIKAV